MKTRALIDTADEIDEIVLEELARKSGIPVEEIIHDWVLKEWPFKYGIPAVDDLLRKIQRRIAKELAPLKFSFPDSAPGMLRNKNVSVLSSYVYANTK